MGMTGKDAQTHPDRSLTALEFVVLGLMGMEPQTGYSIVNYFDEGMYSWSASPGSIYPMLKRLEKQKIIEGELEMEHETRPRKMYRLTPLGEVLLDGWLRESPKMRPFYEQRELGMLKFQFMQSRFTIRETLTWINNYLDTVTVADAHRASYTEALLAALNEQGKSSAFNQLLLEGAMMDQATLRSWLEMARARLEALAIQTGEYSVVHEEIR